jgi:hypothetical protein
MSYGTRHHLARMVTSFDYRFIFALVTLVVAVVLVLRYA